VPVRAFDMLHEFGFVMSYSWTFNAIDKVVEAERQSVKHEAFPQATNGGVALVYDNFNLEAKSFEQCLLNQKVVKSGTVLSICILPAEARILQNRDSLSEGHRHGTTQQFSVHDLIDPTPHHAVTQFVKHHILQYLLDSPKFADYKFCDLPILQCPKPIQQLMGRPEAICRMYIVVAALIDESTYEGNVRVHNLYYELLGWDNKDM
jgi:hypothetical protein